jgi:hypothetical protein
MRTALLFTTFVLFSAFLPIQGIVIAQEQNENIRVEDESFKRQDLRTGETFTIEGNLAAIIIEGLGPILIVLFIIIYAVKKRGKGEKNDKN